QGRKIADAWDPAADEAAGNQCKAYGAGAIMRVPSRFHITWQDDNTLKVESDSGMQTRVLHFGSTAAQPGPRTLQGSSSAQWQAPARNAATAHLKPGYHRQNRHPDRDDPTPTR